MYDQLTALDYNAANTKQKALLDWLRIAIAEYADFLGGIRLIMQTSDAGKQVPSLQNMQAPSKWMFVTSRKETLTNGDAALESALEYLENNKSEFSTWTSSAAYSLSYDLFLSSASELTNYFPGAKKSRRLYLQLREYIRSAETLWGPSVFGSELWKAWKEKHKAEDPELSEKEKQAFTLLRYALAYYAVGESVTFLNITEDWRLLSETDGTVNEDVLNAARRAEIKAECLKKSEKYQNTLLKFLNAHASPTEFAEFYESDLFKPTVSRTAPRFPNDPCKPYFAF